MNNVGRTASKNWLSLVLIFLFTFSVSLVGARFVRSILVGRSSAETKESATETPAQPEAHTIPAAVALQPIIDSWADSADGRVSVLIYDLDRDELAASYNPDNVFSTNGATELILAYDGYRQIDNGIESATSDVIDDLSYGDCLETMARSDSSACAETILSDTLRSERITNFITNLGMTQTKDFAANSSANDLALLLRHIWQHSDLSLNSWAKLQDSLLNSNADWRQGLPSGFSTARVYSKAGGDTNGLDGWLSYTDLALVDFVKQDRHFAVVALGENISDPSIFSRLATLIEGKIIEE